MTSKAPLVGIVLLKGTGSYERKKKYCTFKTTLQNLKLDKKMCSSLRKSAAWREEGNYYTEIFCLLFKQKLC